MKTTPTYSRGIEKDEYDLDHELNHSVEQLTKLIDGIDSNKSSRNKLKILLAMQEVITKEIQENI
jgi:hypothetical protein